MVVTNPTPQYLPPPNCVPQLVAQQAAATPDAVALVSGHHHITYHDLNRRSNQLAHILQRLGVGPNILVALCAEPSFDLIVGLLAILKAGGAYLPLDPAYPVERLSFMLQDAQAPILLTQQHLLTRLPVPQAHIQYLNLDANTAMPPSHSAYHPPSSAAPDDLAYVIYTSGSTGQPKGVQITHRSLLNLVCWHHHAFAVTAADKATQLISPAFDAAVWELWPYLTIGASISLVPEHVRASPPLLRDWLLTCGVTITCMPTILAERLISLPWPSTTSLRYLLTGGDTLQLYPPASLPFAVINTYGPTEATVVATSAQVFPNPQPSEPPSIGRPIANTHVYILDQSLRPAPIGQPGELYLAGIGLARGYHHRPELTAQKFIPSPFSRQPGARLYQTGDRARLLPDGQLAFLDRTDQQIKLRGYRIEPNEIRIALNRQPGVHSSVIVARHDPPAEKQLVAYLVLEEQAQVTGHALREALSHHLPDYMIPAAFVQIDSMPLTLNGKLDWSALPPPDVSNLLPEQSRAGEQARTLLEEQVSEIVSALLGVSRVGLQDNFFMLGVHSLLGAQIISLLSARLGVQLPLRILYQAPTVQQLSAAIEQLLLAKLL